MRTPPRGYTAVGNESGVSCISRWIKGKVLSRPPAHEAALLGVIQSENAHITAVGEGVLIDFVLAGKMHHPCRQLPAPRPPAPPRASTIVRNAQENCTSSSRSHLKYNTYGGALCEGDGSCLGC